MASELAFSGINVLDFTQGVAGPHSTMLLAQHGANVIKIEPPDGDWGRGLGRTYGQHCAHFVAFNRGKRSIGLDMKSERAQAITRDMAAKCDVVVEAFRPGVMAKFGLDYETVKAINPSVIYLSVTGFGQSGPNMNLPVTDAVIQAYSGLMTVNKDSQGMPNRLNMIPIDVTTGLYAFQSLSTALMRKFRYGTGCYIDNNLMQSAAAFQAAKIMEFHLENGEAQVLYVPVGTMRTADGYINITAMREHHYHSLCEAIGLPELAHDERYDTRDKRIEREHELMPVIRAQFTAKTTAQWAEELTVAGVMNAPVMNHGDFMNHEHTKATGAVAYIDHPETGTIPMPHIPGLPRIDGEDAMTRAPQLGEHTDEILTEWGYGAEDLASFREAGVTAE
ncbi:MAG: CoA transferase [Chromatiales bacterium]|jgi:crotonobetainyl-CoA:carnitine CoA-transferase CaiB-like acyl-CoA transferase|nr:CoA transferase [Chromatiales bacterium]